MTGLVSVDQIYKRLREQICEELELAPFLNDEQLKELIERSIFASPDHRHASTGDRLLLASRLFHSFRGLDILQPLIDDSTVTEIMINGPNHIFIEKEGITEQIDLAFESPEKLEDLIQVMDLDFDAEVQTYTSPRCHLTAVWKFELIHLGQNLPLP